MKKNLTVIITLVVAGVLGRLIPHWPNFTPVLAAALFSGVYIKDKKWAFMVPVATMIISDLFLGFHPTMLFVYISMGIIVWMGTMIKKPAVGNVLLASVASSVLFFIVTNFGSWAADAYGLYADDLSGLVASYTAALPYASSQLLPGPVSFATNGFYSDLIYNGVLFGGYALAKQYVPALKLQTA